jgi:hypothetical protein
MARTTTTNAFEWLLTYADLMATLKATETSSSSPTLEGDATCETFPQQLRGSIPAGTAPTIHMLPAFLGY